MDRYFKIERAKEKIERLNVEIHRLVTYMEDEDAFLIAKEKEVVDENPRLAFQIRQHWLERGRYKDMHWRRLKALERKEGFTGTLSVGEGERSVYWLTAASIPDVNEDSDNDDDEGPGNYNDHDVGEELETILTVTTDMT